MKTIKDFAELSLGAVLGGVAMNTMANVAHLPTGVRDATNTLIAGGVMSKAASMIKWK